MTKIKLCGISSIDDVDVINELSPDYIGFVFYKKSKRCVSEEKAKKIRNLVNKNIKTVGVFVDESIEYIAKLANDGIIDIAQLHGNEDESYIKSLKKLANVCVIKAFRVKDEQSIKAASKSTADCILLDSGAGSGTVFNWNILKNISRPYFLAGGLSSANVGLAIKELHPFAVDVSSGIETNGLKDKEKMSAFVAAVRKEENND